MNQPGWYPDPQNPNLQRWWDGAAWTEASRQTTAVPRAGRKPLEKLLMAMGLLIAAILFVECLLAVPRTPPTSPGERRAATYVINKSGVYLFDSPDAFRQAVDLQSRSDYVNLGIHLQAHATHIDLGARVHITHHGILSVRVEEVETKFPGGWTAREFLTERP